MLGPVTWALVPELTGCEVGLRVAVTLPGCSLTAATSVPFALDSDPTVFGTGCAAVDFARCPGPNSALPSVTGMGGRLDAGTLPFALTVAGSRTIGAAAFSTP